MDMSYRIMILALLIGLASAQINFSTSWGKRSSSAIPVAPGLSLSALRQQLHPRRETIGTSQQQQQLQNIAETYSGSASPYSDVEDQRTVPLPSPCLSLLKSLLMVNQIVETEMLRMDKYGRQQQQLLQPAASAPVSSDP